MPDPTIAPSDACIVGWAHSPFGKLEEPDLESLLARVGRAAIEDAGIEPSEVDAGFVGVFGEGFTQQGFPSSLVLHSIPELRFKPLTRFENACATGSAAIHGALDFLAAKRGRFALVLGAEKMTSTPTARVGELLLSASYRKTEQGIAGGFAGVFARIAETYFQQHGDQSDALAAIAAKNHKNGVDNPWAQMRKDLGFEFCRRESEKNPFVAPPLKRTDCSLVSDGAAALVLMRESTASALGAKPLARIVAHAMHAQEPEWFTTAPVGATQKALKKAGWKVEDVDLWEINEAFAVVPLKFIRDLELDPAKVNVNGGAIALGHPIGATGAILIGTLLDELERRDVHRGLVTMCAAGGMAPALIIERV